MRFIFSLLVLTLMLATMPLSAMDNIRYEKGQSKLDVRTGYKLELLRSALDYTVDNYGPYQITTDAPRMNALQARKQLQTGKRLNVFIAVTNNDWESTAIAIKIPVRKGLLNYRLLLIHKNDLPIFENIKTVDELKEQTVGLLYGWSINAVMGEQEFRIKNGNNYDGLFRMLDLHRFNFLPRGINEIFGELAQRKDILRNVVIEPNIALYIPTPGYIFVSRKYPRLAKRLQEGLELMIKDGSFDMLFHKYFDESISKAKLNQRLILKLENVNLPEGTPLERNELWFTP
jgi:hypothetical protein